MNCISLNGIVDKQNSEIIIYILFFLSGLSVRKKSTNMDEQLNYVKQ